MEKEKTNNLVLDVEDKPAKIHQWILFAIQHVLAMLVACITVPLLVNANAARAGLVGVNMPIGATIISAGIGTLIYLAFTKFKSPVFLSSSFAYIAPMSSALTVGLINNATGGNYFALIIGMFSVGLIYVVVGLVVKFVGTAWLNKLLPIIIVGPVIIVIGLGLSSSAISNLMYVYNDSGDAVQSIPAIVSGLVALFVTALVSHYGKGLPKLIPFIIGMLGGYAAALIFSLIGLAVHDIRLQLIDFSIFTDLYSKENIGLASFFNYNVFVPNNKDSFMFLRFEQIKAFDWKTIGTVLLIFVPVAFVTMCEHIGDHENLGNILGRDLLNKEPGMKRTLMGDGVATAVSGALCGAANTTYGENVAVVGLTKIASSAVVLLAALFSIGFGLFTPFTAFLSSIPSCVTGGISLLLYGFIASSGIKMLIKEKVDFSNTKNIFVASVILVSGIGGLSVTFVGGGYPITITSVALSMVLGIVLNFILVDKKKEE